MSVIVKAAAMAAALAWAPAAWGQESGRGRPAACGDLSPNAVVRCALETSPEVGEARAELLAAGGRRLTADAWLPSNPTAAVTLSRRHRPPPEDLTVLNWNVSVSQELEVAGQRGARRAAAQADAAASSRRLTVVEQEVAAGAYTALLQAAAASEAADLARELADNGDALATAAAGRAQEQLLAGVEADVARAEATRLAVALIESDRRVTAGRAGLALYVGPVGTSQLPNLAQVLPAPETFVSEAALQTEAVRLRGDVAAVRFERQVLEARVSLLRRARVPNVTVSAFAERGEIDDRILGVGVAIPLPLPGPIGRSRAGEIDEALAELRASESSAELVRRRVNHEVSQALASYQSASRAVAAFDSGLVGRARTHLKNLREALVGRQLTLREALAWQRSLVELLQGELDARLARAVATIELKRVLGRPFIAAEGARP